MRLPWSERRSVLHFNLNDVESLDREEDILLVVINCVLVIHF